MEDAEINAAARLIYETGLLKLSRRTGWWICGVKDPETVAEHSFRAAIIAGLLAGMEGADPERATYLAIWHDTQETRTGDVPHIGRRYLKAARNEEITREQTSGLAPAAGEHVRDAVAEYEAVSSPEAACARDADRLDCLFQAIAYRDAGSANVGGWIESSSSGLRTESAKKLAEAATTMTSQDWHNYVMRHPATDR
jgi:putative hydrolase of HD superfamily